ncbi:MAG: methionyl-tRNA formyltransferase [Coriobacteriia bacterium]|nr:methionyl-tRNA formyltransferase [Coriobacteriia bacterium]
MRFAFFGTPPFAARILELLLEAGLRPEFVVTQPDAASRRGSKLWPSAVAEVATREGLALEKPDNLRDPAFAARLRALDLDCVVLAAYGRIISPALLEIPRQGWINVHASLLPRWRGAAPIERAILAGDKTTGVSIMRMEVGLDTGPYCAQAEVSVTSKNSELLIDQLAVIGAELLVTELPKLINDAVIWKKQDETQVTYADKIDKHELDLSPEQAAVINVRRVLASSDNAPARLTLMAGSKEITLRVLCAARRVFAQPMSAATPGTAFINQDFDYLELMCTPADIDCVDVMFLQPAGKRPQTTADWLRGLRLDPEEALLSWR